MYDIAVMQPSVIGIKESTKYFFIQLNYCAINLRLHHIQIYRHFLFNTLELNRNCYPIVTAFMVCR